MAPLAIDLSHALRGFTLELRIEVGAEVVALVGASGAGKTTALRCVAGLLRPDSGSVQCGETTWVDRAAGVDAPPERRSVGYVPQHQALFPHLTVAQNVAFGGATDDEVMALLERLRIRSLAPARPGSLSGGERQRVALARALARSPDVLLLDEPLAALDAHTRSVVRDELADELRTLGIPTLLVTHDFADARALADRVAVLVSGHVLQLGTPQELIAAPADAFVMSFTGGYVMSGRGRGAVVALDDGGEVPVDVPAHGDVQVGLRPWDVEVRRGPGPPGALTGVVRGLAAEGARVRVRAGGWWGEAGNAEGLVDGDVVHGLARRGYVFPARRP
jgi:molybdate transport system ATP-binding protein